MTDIYKHMNPEMHECIHNCEACAKSCDEMGDTECAEVCRRCAKTCREISAKKC